MKDIVAIVIIAALVVLALRYIIKQKKSGAACIGCPHAGACGKAKGEASLYSDNQSCCCGSEATEEKHCCCGK